MTIKLHDVSCHVANKTHMDGMLSCRADAAIISLFCSYFDSALRIRGKKSNVSVILIKNVSFTFYPFIHWRNYSHHSHHSGKRWLYTLDMQSISSQGYCGHSFTNAKTANFIALPPKVFDCKGRGGREHHEIEGCTKWRVGFVTREFHPSKEETLIPSLIWTQIFF